MKDSKDLETKFSFRQYYGNMFSNPIEQMEVRQNQKTGEEHALVKTRNGWNIVHTPEDNAYYGNDEKTARKTFNEFYGHQKKVSSVGMNKTKQEPSYYMHKTTTTTKRTAGGKPQ